MAIFSAIISVLRLSLKLFDYPRLGRHLNNKYQILKWQWINVYISQDSIWIECWMSIQTLLVALRNAHHWFTNSCNSKSIFDQRLEGMHFIWLANIVLVENMFELKVFDVYKLNAFSVKTHFLYDSSYRSKADAFNGFYVMNRICEIYVIRATT